MATRRCASTHAVRPTAGAACLALALALLPPAEPASAAGGVVRNGLTKPGTSGVLRVVAVAADRYGVWSVQHGDPYDRQQDQARTVGDREPPPPAGAGPACADNPAPTDCYRALGVNHPDANPSAADGHAHHHAGDSAIVVGEVSGFLAGDTILVGSPYCNMPRLGMTCARWVPGFGYVEEQPAGEIAHITSITGSGHGPGILRLHEPLAADHRPGEQVVKLPTVYLGQDMQVAVSNEALFDTDPVPFGPLTVRATLVPPQGRRSPWDPAVRRSLAVLGTKTVYEQQVEGPGGVTTFFVPREITAHATVGRTFDLRTDDSWYTVEVVARDPSGHVVQDGALRFKINPIAIASLVADPSRILPFDRVLATGLLRDASSPAALARRVENVDVDVVVRKPRGTRSFRVRSCYDYDASAADICGADPFLGQGNMHGNFFVQIGGTACNSRNPGHCTNPSRATRGMTDTQDAGQYRVEARVRRVVPAVLAATTFDVALIA